VRQLARQLYRLRVELEKGVRCYDF
jgi:hypothetical protein